MKLLCNLPTFHLTLLVALACCPLASCSRTAVEASTTATPVPVRATRAVLEDVPLEIAAVGNVESIHSVDVKSRVGGQIDTVAFSEGQNVSKGQLLFNVGREILERQQSELQATLERDAAMEQQGRAVIARDTAAEKQSLSEADVARQLGKLGILSDQRVSQLMTSSDTAQAALRADQASVQAAVSATKVDRARLTENQLQLHFTEITSPISGRAGAVIVKPGNMVRENETTLVTLLQLAPIYVTFGVPEQSLLEIRRLSAAGQLTAEAGIDGTSSSSTIQGGHLSFIDNTVDATTGTIRLKAVFPNTDNALWPGEFVKLRLRLGIEKGRTVVPESAIQNGLSGKYLWLLRSGTALTAPVDVVRTYRPADGPEQAIVSSGIKPGDEVVTEGQLRLTTGATVALLNAPRGR